MSSKNTLAAFALAISFLSFTTSDQKKDPEKRGKALFEHNCVKCHGVDGTKGKWGATNLQLSTLSDAALLTIITHGKRMMPSWNQSLTKNEIEIVKDYIKTLRKQ